MAVDEALLESVIEGHPPCLRLYAWEPPAVSLGYFQALDENIDEDEIKRRGFGLVRRPTGGRAILHKDEITYSVVVRQSDIEGGESLMGSYRTISRGIEQGLRVLGVGAELADHSGKDGQESRHSLPTVCFGQSARVDMVAAGRKIVGSAQTRRKGAILQHGSIPISIDVTEHIAVMPGGIDGTAAVEAGAQMLQEAACGLADILGHRPTFDQLVENISHGFAEALGITLQITEPTQVEMETARDLLEQKYGSESWTRRTPRRG